MGYRSQWHSKSFIYHGCIIKNLQEVETQQLFQIILRVPKKDSAFTYFTLESHEGLCMYSTLEESLNQDYRDLNLVGTIEFKFQVLTLIENLSKKFPLEIRALSVFEDGEYPTTSLISIISPP